MRKVGSFESENVIFPLEVHSTLTDVMIYGIMLMQLRPIHFTDLDIFQVKQFTKISYWFNGKIILSAVSIDS